MAQNRYQFPGQENWTHDIEAECTTPVQDGVQTVESNGIQNGYSFMYGRHF